MVEPLYGIYRIALSDGRCYVGQSACAAGGIRYRWKNERSELRRGRFNGNAAHYLQRAWDKYGEDAFIFEVLETLDVNGLTTEEIRDCLNEREQWWIDNTDSVFNLAPAAGSTLGMRFGPMSEATKAKLSAANSGQKRSPEFGKKISAAKRGVPLSPEHRAKISAAKRGAVASPEQRAALLRYARGPRSAETRERMGAARSAWWKARRAAESGELV